MHVKREAGVNPARSRHCIRENSLMNFTVVQMPLSHRREGEQHKRKSGDLPSSTVRAFEEGYSRIICLYGEVCPYQNS